LGKGEADGAANWQAVYPQKIITLPD
jgi:hypothetical protein